MATFEITDPLEAHLVLQAITEARIDNLLASAQHGVHGEYADVAAKILGRVEQRIVDTFIPEAVGDGRWEHRLDEAELGLA